MHVASLFILCLQKILFLKKIDLILVSFHIFVKCTPNKLIIYPTQIPKSVLNKYII